MSPELADWGCPCTRGHHGRQCCSPEPREGLEPTGQESWWTVDGLASGHLPGQRETADKGQYFGGFGHRFLGESVEEGLSLSRAPPWLSLVMPKAAHSSKAGPESVLLKTMAGSEHCARGSRSV